MVAAGLNSVRVPLGFWIIEDIVDQNHEPYAENNIGLFTIRSHESLVCSYAQGGLDELVRVCYGLFLQIGPKPSDPDPRPKHVQKRRVMCSCNLQILRLGEVDCFVFLG